MSIKSTSLILTILFALFMVLAGCTGGQAEDESENSADKDSTVQTENSDTDKQPENKNGKNEEEDEELELIPVEVESAVKGDISQYLLLSASLKTEEQVAVFPETGGIIRSILVDEGDRVKEGDTLLVLDDEEKTLDRDAALIDYQQSEAEFERAAELRNQNLISKEEYDRFRFDKDRARIRYDRAELELRRTRVLAPISGYIAQKLVYRGDLVNMNSRLYSLVNPRDMIAEVHIPEIEVPRVGKDKRVVVYSDVFPDKSFPARIKRISPVVDEASGTFRVIVGVHDEKELLRPGMFVNVNIVTSVHRDVVLVPKQAVIYENDLPIIYVVQDSLALRIRLHTGFNDNKYIESLINIKPGDTIVTVGQASLKDSAKIKIIDMDKIRREAIQLAEANSEKLNGKDKEQNDAEKSEE